MFLLSVGVRGSEDLKTFSVYRLLKTAFYMAVFFIITASVYGASANVVEQSSSNSSSSASSIDIDGNEQFDALTDGLLILRSMFGLTGSSLVAGAVADNAIYADAQEIELRINSLGSKLDVDGNDEVDALTDGLLILRHLFGLTEGTLIQSVVGDGALRNTAADLTAYIDLLMLLDNDGDGVSNENDAFPEDPTETVDTDLDGIGNNADSDDDGDGVNDDSDAFPLDPAETVDTDLDGVGNNADTDDDGDFQIDADELTCGSDPLDATSNSDDFDTDNSPDCVDTDDDNDGVLDIDDYYPLEPLLSEINCNLVFSPTYPQCLSDSISSSEFYSNGEDVVVLDWDGFSKIPGVIYELQGTNDDDVLIGTDGNDRIEGSADPFGRFEDGYDILIGGKGDDILIGGPNNSSVGGCIADIYRFDDDSGNDMILGFTLSLSGYSGCSVVDRIEIPAGINGTTITSATDVLSRITSNSDGWAVIDLGSSNSITLHGKSRDLITLGQITVL